LRHSVGNRFCLQRLVSVLKFITERQGRSQEFCSGEASHWRRQISNFSYFTQRSFDVTGQFLVYYHRIWRQISSTNRHI